MSTLETEIGNVINWRGAYIVIKSLARLTELVVASRYFYSSSLFDGGSLSEFC